MRDSEKYKLIFVCVLASQTDVHSLNGSCTVLKCVAQFALDPSTQTILYSGDQAIYKGMLHKPSDQTTSDEDFSFRSESGVEKLIDQLGSIIMIMVSNK